MEIVRTSDGSDTIYSPRFGQHYHSTHGAITESLHVFIETGLLHYIQTHQVHPAVSQPVQILEIGFGTGLNAFLTCLESKKQGLSVHYSSLEPFPIDESEWKKLNYPSSPAFIDHSEDFVRMHLAPWNAEFRITDAFILLKINKKLQEYFLPQESFHVVYFDAFSPDVQPELWGEQTFLSLFQAMKPGGVLTTYSVKGDVVRALRSVGFHVEKLPGPPGKRHILRATKAAKKL